MFKSSFAVLLPLVFILLFSRILLDLLHPIFFLVALVFLVELRVVLHAGGLFDRDALLLQELVEEICFLVVIGSQLFLVLSLFFDGLPFFQGTGLSFLAGGVILSRISLGFLGSGRPVLCMACLIRFCLRSFSRLDGASCFLLLLLSLGDYLLCQIALLMIYGWCVQLGDLLIRTWSLLHNAVRFLGLSWLRLLFCAQSL